MALPSSVKRTLLAMQILIAPKIFNAAQSASILKSNIVHTTHDAQHCAVRSGVEHNCDKNDELDFFFFFY